MQHAYTAAQVQSYIQLKKGFKVIYKPVLGEKKNYSLGSLALIRWYSDTEGELKFDTSAFLVHVLDEASLAVIFPWDRIVYQIKF